MRRSSLKESEQATLHFFYAPYRCRNCHHRAFRLSGTWSGFLLALGMSLIVLSVFLVFVAFGGPTPFRDTVFNAVSARGSTALVALTARAAKGEAGAQYTLGIMYLNGTDVAMSDTEATRWLALAARQNHTEAALKLALLYKNGREALQDYAQAAQWFRKAAQQGNAEAQYYLGMLYSIGQGLKQDRERAYVWLNFAAYNGYTPAGAARDEVASVMTHTEFMAAQSLLKNWKTADGEAAPVADKVSVFEKR